MLSGIKPLLSGKLENIPDSLGYLFKGVALSCHALLGLPMIRL
jgi:hypothetical protein